MSEDISKSKTAIIVAIITGMFICIAAAIGLGQPIMNRLVDVYFPPITPIFTVIIPTSNPPITPLPAIVSQPSATSTPVSIYPTATIQQVVVTNTPVTTIAPAPRTYDLFPCLQPCLDNGANASHTFPEYTTKLYVRWNYENIPVGAHYIRIWTIDGQEWAKYDCIWPGPETGVDEITLTEPEGLSSGTWEMSISINDKVVLREQILVEGNWTYWDPAGIFNSCYGKQP